MTHDKRERPIEDEYSLEGYQAYDTHYEKIGKVDDLFVDQDDNPEYIGVKTGFLGTRTALIPIESVRINDKRKLVEVEAEKETVKGGPTFGDDREITPQFERRVLDYYKVETREASSTERVAYGAYYSDAMGDERVDARPGERAARPRERLAQDRLGTSSREGADRRERVREVKDEDELRVQRIEEDLRVSYSRARGRGHEGA